jgi:hypothetical protein
MATIRTFSIDLMLNHIQYGYITINFPEILDSNGYPYDGIYYRTLIDSFLSLFQPFRYSVTKSILDFNLMSIEDVKSLFRTFMENEFNRLCGLNVSVYISQLLNIPYSEIGLPEFFKPIPNPYEVNNA